MQMAGRYESREHGSVLLVVAVFLATALAGLAAISSGRVVYASRQQRVLEQGTRALNTAYAQIHFAMNVVNNSAYDADNRNLVLRDAIAGINGGSAAAVGDTPKIKRVADLETGYVINDGTVLGKGENGRFLDHKEDPEYGLIPATNVRVYRARDYISRLQRLKGEPVEDVDPAGLSDSYFVLEAAGRIGDTVRLVSALVRENEPFSSFVFFQNRATLGISGAPRGLTHCNEKIAFYFPNGNYVDSVSAVDGFEYVAGATEANTAVRNGNPSAARIELSNVDFGALKNAADTFVGADGLDAEVKMYSSGRVRVREYTPPRHEMVTRSYTYNKYVGYNEETYMGTERQIVGTREVEYEEWVIDEWEEEEVTTTERVQTGTTTETRTRQVQVVAGTKEVAKTRQEAVYEEQTVTKYKWVKTWVSYNQGDAGGGTSVAGGGSGELGEYVWVKEPYETTEMVQTGTKTIAYTETETVYATVNEEYTVTVPVYEDRTVTRTIMVPEYEWEERTRIENIYEDVEVEKTRRVYDYERVTYTWDEEVFFAPVYQGSTYIDLDPTTGSTIYIDGRITRLYGDLQGRLTIIGNEKVRITGSIRYVDGQSNTAMKNGSDWTKPYGRNPDYTGRSTLGVIARDDILMTDDLPNAAEINATLMSVNGRAGIDGFWADETGELHKDSSSARDAYLTEEQRERERAYDSSPYHFHPFVYDSMRRIGGIVSNDRVMETYITTRSDGTSQVSAGFKRGSAKYDINLLFNPPPNFVEVPRPVVTTFLPVIVTLNDD